MGLRSIKQTMKMDVLRGKTPDRVRIEIWAHLLAYNLIRKVMAQAQQTHQKNPRHLSFKLARQVIDAFRQAGLFCEDKLDVYQQFPKAIACKTVGKQPGRQEPRRVKRKPRHLYRKEVAEWLKLVPLMSGRFQKIWITRLC